MNMLVYGRSHNSYADRRKRHDLLLKPKVHASGPEQYCNSRQWRSSCKANR